MTEKIRVCKPGGIIAVGSSWVPESYNKKLKEVRRYNFKREVHGTQDILNWFGSGVMDQVYLNQDLAEVGKNRSHGQNLLLIFSIKK